MIWGFLLLPVVGGCSIDKLMGGIYEVCHSKDGGGIHRQHGEDISLFSFFQNNESRVKNPIDCSVE
jgi:hypothetical protein